MIKPLIVGVSGASGLIYAVRALKYLLAADYRIELVASRATYMIWQAEENIRMPSEPDQQEVFGEKKLKKNQQEPLTVIVGEMWEIILLVALFVLRVW